MSDSIQNGTVVHFHYTLTDGRGRVLDSSAGRDPLGYLHGAGNIVPGLERQLTGLVVGDRLQASVAPEEGYGVREEIEVPPVPRGAFAPGTELVPGMQLFARSPDGETIVLWVTRVEPEFVIVDVNHPLAGVTLHFDVEITGIRAATEEEMTHGHPHGPGGHAH